MCMTAATVGGASCLTMGRTQRSGEFGVNGVNARIKSNGATHSSAT